MKRLIAEENSTEGDYWQYISKRLQELHDKICSSYIRFLVHSDSDKSGVIRNLQGFNRHALKPTSLVWAAYDDQPKITQTTCDLGFPINFVSRVFPTVPAGHEDSAPLRILAAMMGAKYLLPHIRETGGAYGAGAQQQGEAFRFFSYRDPAGLQTLTKFSHSVHWVLDQYDSDSGRGWGQRDVDEALLKVSVYFNG